MTPSHSLGFTAPVAIPAQPVAQIPTPRLQLQLPQTLRFPPSTASVLPKMPIALPVTLFLLEAHIQGGWLPLVIPYIFCLILFYL
ncbi:hypothetical protein B0H13DRAFT_2346403 [Mycena leptocephala]|nr:hypothetical protein B0H13DRAFT_2346403 [Mycena leptocephala]